MIVYAYNTALDRSGVNVPAHFANYLSSCVSYQYAVVDDLVVPGVTSITLPTNVYSRRINYVRMHATVEGMAGYDICYFATPRPDTTGSTILDLELDSIGTLSFNGGVLSVMGSLVQGHEENGLGVLRHDLELIQGRPTVSGTCPFGGGDSVCPVFRMTIRRHGTEDKPEKRMLFMSPYAKADFDALCELIENVITQKTVYSTNFGGGTPLYLEWDVLSVDAFYLLPGVAFVPLCNYADEDPNVREWRFGSNPSAPAFFLLSHDLADSSTTADDLYHAYSATVLLGYPMNKLTALGNYGKSIPLPRTNQYINVGLELSVFYPTASLGVNIIVDGVRYDFSDALLVSTDLVSRDSTSAQDKISDTIRYVSAAGGVAAATGAVIGTVATGGALAPVLAGAIPGAVSGVGAIASTTINAKKRDDALVNGHLQNTLFKILGNVPQNEWIPCITTISYSAANGLQADADAEWLGYDYPTPLQMDVLDLLSHEITQNYTFYRFADPHVNPILVHTFLIDDIEARLAAGLRIWQSGYMDRFDRVNV